MKLNLADGVCDPGFFPVAGIGRLVSALLANELTAVNRAHGGGVMRCLTCPALSLLSVRADARPSSRSRVPRVL